MTVTEQITMPLSQNRSLHHFVSEQITMTLSLNRSLYMTLNRSLHQRSQNRLLHHFDTFSLWLCHWTDYYDLITEQITPSVLLLLHKGMETFSMRLLDPRISVGLWITHLWAGIHPSLLVSRKEQDLLYKTLIVGLGGLGEWLWNPWSLEAHHLVHLIHHIHSIHLSLVVEPW